MKTDRLYGITLYLLNHGKTSATILSKKFEVSIRTIQRDIDSLCRVGIPIVSETGVDGGYYLSESFRMDKQTVTNEDYGRILTALKGYSAAMGNADIDSTVEKISALAKKKDSSIILDFSVLQEVDKCLMQMLQEAIKVKKAVCFNYTNAANILHQHIVEPVAVIYQWYAWYMLAYSKVTKDYRIFKLVRMSDVVITEENFTREHEDANVILKESNKNNMQLTTEIKIRCKPEGKSKVIEYLNGVVTSEYDNGECEMNLYVIESEHLWFGTILSLGDSIVIKEPEYIRKRIIETAEKIIHLYNKL